MPQVRADLDFTSTGARITGLLDAVADQEPATFAQVKAAIEGIAWKDSVRVATQSNLNLSSPGATIDGITMAADDRVLVMNQSTGSQNGIYIWNGAAVAMTRSADASTAAELEQAATTVEEGTSAGATYRQTTVNFTLGSGSVAWTTFGATVGAASTSSAGIVQLATSAETSTGTDTSKAITPDALANSNKARKAYAATFGDGAATQYDITHNLGTVDITAVVKVVSTGAVVICDITATSTTVVRLNFAAAPATNTLRVTVTA